MEKCAFRLGIPGGLFHAEPVASLDLGDVVA